MPISNIFQGNLCGPGFVSSSQLIVEKYTLDVSVSFPLFWGLLAFLIGRTQLLFLRLNPSLNAFSDTTIGAFCAELFKSLNLSLDLRDLFRREHGCKCKATAQW